MMRLLSLYSRLKFRTFCMTAGSVLAASLMVLAACSFSTAEGPPEGEVLVRYFHRTLRCPSCNLIETLTGVALELGFKEELASKSVTYQVLNMDDAANAHYVQEFELSEQSVIICSVSDDGLLGCKKMVRIWELLHDEPEFISYIQSEVARRMK